MNTFDAAVVGSGPNGLAAAVALAQTGRKVVVYEAAASPGGGTRTEAVTLPHFQHDICSAIHPMGLASPFFRALELEREGLTWIHPEVPLAHPLDREPAALLHRSLDETAAGLGADADAWTALFAPIEEGFAQIIDDSLGPLRIPRHPWRMSRFGLQALRSAKGLARGWFTTERAQALFAGVACHSVLPLETASSAAIGLVLSAAGHHVGWPIAEGGSSQISKALVSRLRRLGGDVVCDRPITDFADIDTEGPVLFDTSPRALADIAKAQLPPRYRDRLLSFRHGPGSCKVDYALDGPVPWRDPNVLKAGTVHLGGSLDELAIAERAPHQGDIPDRPYVLVAQQSLFDASRAPEGKHTLWAYCHVPNGCDEDVSDRIEAQIERFAPGFKDLILQKHVRTATGLETYNANYVGGDIGGGVVDLRQLFARPVSILNPYATPHPRIFLCSASTPPAGGVHGMCGFFAARAAAPEVKLSGR